jgi:hypothetical protein
MLKCRPLTKYNPNNKTLFEKELIKQNFEQSLKAELERFEKVRQNVGKRNPNDSNNSNNINDSNNSNKISSENSISVGEGKAIVKRKPTISNNNTSNTSYNTSSYDNSYKYNSETKQY